MRKMKKIALEILSIFLIGTILLNDGTMIKACASGVSVIDVDEGSGENTEGNTGGETGGNTEGGGENTGGNTGDGGENTGGNTGDEGENTGGNTGDEGENTGGNTGDEGENTGGNTGDGEGNTGDENDGENTGGETGDHDGEKPGENPDEDADSDSDEENKEEESENDELEEEEVTEPEEDIEEEEDSTDEEHIHTWIREDGEIFPVCTECGEVYFDEDCDPEAGIGIHIFELIQEEGQEDRFRCAICGFERDFLEEWDLTVELYLLIAGIETYSFTYGGETSSLPSTLAELQQAEADGYYGDKTFSVKNLADLMALQSLSQEFSFEDYTIVFVGREYPDEVGGLRRWDLTPLKNSYKGLGTAEFPFKGTLRTFYSDNSLYFETSTPLLNYVATGATVYDFQISADINSESGDPVGIIAAHVVKDDRYDEVNLGNLILSGTVKNSQGAAGVIFGEADGSGEQPVSFTYQTDANITMSAGVVAKNAGGIVGKTTGNVEIYTMNPITTGEINGSESAGMLAGSMEDGKLCLEDGEIRANVNGSGASGGLIGIIKNGKIEGAEDGKVLTVSGTVKGTVAAGGLAGRCETTDTQVKNLVVSASVAGTSTNVNNGSAVGGVIGKFISSNPAGEGQYEGDYDLIDQVSVSGLLDVGRAIGGVIGEIEGSNIRIGDPDSGSISVTGNINASMPDAGAANGGIAGIARGQYIEVYHAQVSNIIRRGASIGGIFGIVGDESGTDRSIVKTKDVTITATIEQPNASTTRGGIFGTVKKGSMAALDGAINVDLSYNFSLHHTDHVKTGYIAGEQIEALIYLETGATYNRREKAWKDDIGSYGGVYRNGNWGEESPLISYAEKGVTGSVGQSGGAWLLDTEADVIRLALALNTDGKFAGSCFSDAGKSSLLSAKYQLENKTYELTDSGIYSMNRNDETGCNEVFSGSIDGNGAVLRLGSYDTYQKYVALFPCVGNGAEFSNFTLEGEAGGPRKIQYAKGAAGLAVYGQNNVVVSNVKINTDLTGNPLNTAYLYGGMIAKFTAGAGTTLTVEETSISGNITINQNNAGNLNQKQYVGGMIAQYDGNSGSMIKIDQLNLNQQITSNSRYASGMITRINSQNTNTDKTILDMFDITVMNGSSLTITDGSNISNDDMNGGFLGREWFDVTPCDGNYSIKNLTVGYGSGTAPALRVNGTFGGMIHTVTGRIQVVDTKISGMRVTGNNTGNDGLLINNGYNALIEIDGYTVAGLSASGVNDFSEIVGRNIGTGPTDANYADYIRGGIVNIISKEFENGSQVYRDQQVPEAITSGKVRYYYNLFGDTLAGESAFLSAQKLDGSKILIENADQMLIWHLNQYMNDTIRTRYLAPYFTDGKVPDRNGDVIIKGTIDLANESYYPTPVEGLTVSGDGALIIFNAKDIVDKADTGRKPSSQGEHYMMHSGLFLSKAGTVMVQGSAPADAKVPVEDKNYLTLSGTVSDVGGNSGALFSKEISGSKNIYRINLKELYIYNYSGDHEHGLLIGKINDNSTVDMSWVRTEYSSAGKKAASALIGVAGRADTTTTKGTSNISIEFTNIKLDDKKSGIFQNATLIDQFYYTDDTAINKGRVRYLFTKEASEGTDGDDYDPFLDDIHGHNNYIATGEYITLGSELEHGIEYWNEDGDIHMELLPGNNWVDYLPYVCTHPESKEPEVNPKINDIIRGCGTYEDPYVIDHPKQILALSRYLTNAGDVKYLTGWKVNKIGNNASFCDGNHEESDQIAYGEAGFPTQDQLRQAYYIIEKDLDLSSLAYVTDRNIAQEFVGLGTEDKPFAGVIIGRTEDGSFPTITLPRKKASNYATNFGLIQYAKGAVVKDITITGNQEEDSLDATLTDCIRVKENAGAVFACVLGGDNIIDNVTVSSRIMPVRDAAAADTEVAVGGYVGTVRQGSVILRNLSEDSLKDFRCLTNVSGALESVTPADYPYVSGMIGKVENGFVMYDGAYDDKEVLSHNASGISGIYSNNDLLPVSQTYDIIAAGAARMQEAKNTPMNIIRGSNGDFSCEIRTAAQLQVVSMAINSDAFSVYYDGGGYDKNAVCRKAQYNKVGACASTDPDYLAATQKDDGSYWYPYIYDYFTFDGTKASDSGNGSQGFYNTLESYSSAGSNGKTAYRCRLNAVTGDISARMSYSLVSGNEYDLSVYGRGFRGLGATYRVFENDRTAYRDSDLNVKTNSVYSDFRADFDGKGATVNAVMINDYDHTIHTIALFNDLIDVDAQNEYTIQNLVVTGVFNNSYTDRNLAGEINYRNDRAAAVVGMMRRSWQLTDITVKDAAVKSDGHAAAVVAWINPGNEKADQKSYLLENCTLTGKSSVTTAGGSSGGIVGVMTPAMPGTVKDLALALTNCKVSGSEDVPVIINNDGNGLLSAADNNDQYRYGRGRTGGLIGFIGKRSNRDINGNVNAAYDDRAKVIINVNIKGTDNGNTVEYVEVNGVDSTGGILGEYFGYSIENDMFLTNQADTLTFESVNVFESTVISQNRNETGYNSFGAGGIVGKIGRATGCKISDSKVLHTDVKAVYFDTSADAKVTVTTASAGGVAGSVYFGSRIVLSNLTVEGKADTEKNPESEISSVTCDAGGLIGRNINPGNASANPERTSFDIVDSKVIDMNILSDDRTESTRKMDSASGTSAGMVGGMVGRADCIKITVRREVEEYSAVENCIIRTGKDGNAGGILGQTYNGSNYTFEGIRVADSKIGYNADLTAIGFYGAGGMIGKIGAANGSNPTNLATGTLRKVEVSSCDIFGRMTGGLFGYVYRTVNIGNIWSNDDDDILIKENNILGMYAGGVIGCNDSSVTKTCFEHVTVEGNRILALWNGDCYSGGFCGREYLNGINNDYNQITIKDNWIMSCNYSGNRFNENQASGGMFGYIGRNAELYAFETKLENNHIGYYEFKGVIGDILKAGKDQLNIVTSKVQSLGTDESTMPRLLGRNNEMVTSMPAGLTEDTIIDYAKRIGNIVGVYEKGSMQVYFIKPTVTYTSGYQGVRPVVDVGSSNIGTAGDTLLVSPYDYRQNIHIVYFEPDESGNGAAQSWSKLIDVTGYKEKNLFSQINIEEIIKEYQDAKSAAGTTDQLLDAYRLNLKIENDARSSVEEVYSMVYFGPDENGVDSYLSPIHVNGAGLPMIVLDARNGTADQLMHSVLAMLTGSGGVLNSGENDKNNVYDHGLFKITDIKCERMEIENGVLRSVTGEDPSLTYNSTGTAAGNNGHKEFIYTRKFDTTSDAGGTFTMVTITYGKDTYTPIEGTANCKPQVTIKIPVFVMERLTIDTYLKLVEGAAYDVEEAKEKGIEKDPMLATDSSYTMYVEYIYGEARNSFSTEENPLSIEKTIGRTKIIDNKETNVPFPAGTIFTLIDVCDSNKVYYYEVTGTETEAIPYTAFTDASGNPYSNKPIHGEKGLEVHEGNTDLFVTNGESYQDVAVERFLIVVDAPKDHLESGTGDISNYHAAPVLTDDISKRTTLTEHTDLVVTIQEGPKIRFLTENMETTITGNIDREVHLTADGQFQIKADEAYWLRVLNSPDSVIDSANHGKFLEVGLYLTANSNEGERIPLPDNTNVSIYLERLVPLPGEIQPDKNIGSFVNTAEIYLYKDGKLQFPLDALKELIEREMNDSDNKTRGEVTIHFTIDLGFELADLSEYVDDKYGVHLELLRTGEAAYPAGGDIIDVYEDDCYGTRPSELACAIETKDLMQLGINIYDNQARPEEVIDFTFKLDFTGVWDEHNKQANQERADAYYIVTYRILEKTNRDGEPVYRPYTGNNLEIVLVNNPDNAGDQSGGGKQPQLSSGASSTGSEINSRYVTYRFAYNEIENGSNGESIEQAPLVILRDLQLVVKDTADLGLTDLTNYKIQASVMISDTPINDIDDRVNPALSDFFVFTVANLKTDLDY